MPHPEQFNAGDPTCLCYVITGKKHDFFGNSIVTDRTGNCTSEHTF